MSLVVLAVTPMLNPICLYLLPFTGYSYTKRFTWLSHWLLGITDGLGGAPAPWLAIQGRLDGLAFLLWFAVAVWNAGFDLIPVRMSHSIGRRAYASPGPWSVAAALRWARISHTF